jgi:arginase
MEIQLVLVPYDTALRGWRSGAGPEHLLAMGLVPHLQERGHHVTSVQVIESDHPTPAEIATGFDLIRRVADAVRSARAAGDFPVVLSGNCNAAVGTLSGLTPARRAIFWFDAHGDCNTPETTSTGFLDGTGLTTALGLCWRQLTTTIPGFEPVDVAAAFLLGVRDLDPPERALIDTSGIRCVPSARIPEHLLEVFAGAPLHDALGYVHIDLDVLDPDVVGRANSYPVAGGLTVEQLTGAIGAIRATIPLGAAALASYAPEYDRDGAVRRAAFAALDAVLAADPVPNEP